MEQFIKKGGVLNEKIIKTWKLKKYQTVTPEDQLLMWKEQIKKD